ncbi:MAG: STAS domain-containing protein [Defluviitaleaceae bacterium]|nr:STAS domain-containing protein [Defluviitaleaceae bacterium]MCL2264224.1 STAS domain-containing protein [Defluviitaleaceae bacterium]
MEELTIHKNIDEDAWKNAGSNFFYKVQYFELVGRLNTTTAKDFEKEMNQALRVSEYITLNLSRVTLLTSVGIRIILKTYKQCHVRNGKFLLEDPSQPVKNVLGLSALEKMLGEWAC